MPPSYPLSAWLTPALGALLFYGLGQGLVKKYIEDVSPARFCLFFVIARTLVGLAFFLVWEHPAALAPEGRAFLWTCFFVYILDGVGWILYYRSILIGPITIVGTLSAAYPALTVFLAGIFLHEVLNLRQYLGVTLVLGGCAAMAYSPAPPGQEVTSKAWVWLGGTALACWGSAQTLLKYAYTLPQASEINAMLYMTWGGWLTLGIYGLRYGLAEGGQSGNRLAEWARAMIPMGMMAAGDAGVLVATRYGKVAIVAPLTAAYPVITIAFARFALHEQITTLQYAGVGATLLGMFMTC